MKLLTMKGYVPVDIRVKPYIKAYIHAQLGADLKLKPGAHVIYKKIFMILEREQNRREKEALCNYAARIRVYIPMDLYRRRGCNLNATNILDFNTFVEDLIKDRFYTMMDDLSAKNPGFSEHLPFIRERLGIDVEAWSDDSMKKDYYRHRLRKNKKLFYKKSFGRNIPFKNDCSSSTLL